MKIVCCCLTLLLVLPAALGAAEPEDAGRFPRVSAFQERAATVPAARPLTPVATEHGACGPNPSLPSNCRYLCIRGVPVHLEDGSPAVFCYAIQPPPGGSTGCMAGNQCSSGITCSIAPIYEGCVLSSFVCDKCAI